MTKDVLGVKSDDHRDARSRRPRRRLSSYPMTATALWVTVSDVGVSSSER